jgi:predicted amidophosphoribosyltransferase
MLLGGLLAPPLCWSCRGPTRDALCRGCRGSLQRLAIEPVWLCGVRVWAPLAYAGPARDLVGALKFRGAIGVADAMAAQIAANAPRDLLRGSTLVPVPLHPRRLRSRGYNQAAAIAEALARRTGLELADRLVRTGPQVA